MGNSQSAPSPRRKSSSKDTTSPTTPRRFRSNSITKANNKLSKPKVGGESPTGLPISLPGSLSRRNSKASIQNVLPDRGSLSPLDGGAPYTRSPARSGSVDLARQNSLTAVVQGWSNNPSRKTSRETLNNGGGSNNTGASLGAVWLERRRSLVHEPMNKPGSPPSTTMSPVSYIRPMTAPAAENGKGFDISPMLEPDDMIPPPTASSTASFHSALQSPTRIQLTPSPTKLLGSQQQSPTPPSSYNPEPSYIPVRRRSLLQAAAPGIATRPKAQEPEPDLDMSMDDDLLFVPRSRFLSIGTDGTRPETPQDQGTLGSLRKGSLYVANGAPSPIPSSPSLRATSGSSSQQRRDSSLLSLPPVPATVAVETLDSHEEEEEISPQSATKSENFSIKRKPVGSSTSTPSSPQNAKKPEIQVDTATPASSNPARRSLRLVPPSPDKEAPDTAKTLKPEIVFPDNGDESTDEDPHKRHIFGLRNKQFLNGQFQPSPSSDYSQTNTSAAPSAGPSAKPGLARSPFSYEGSKLLHATNPYAPEVEGGERYSVAVEPSKGFMGMDTPELEQIKPKPLVIRKSLPPSAAATVQVGTMHPSGPSTTETEEKHEPSSDASDVSSDQSRASQKSKQSTADSGYASAGSSVLPSVKSWRKAKNRQSAPEHLAQDFNNRYPDMRPATSHGNAESNITTSVITVPFSSVRNRTPPSLQPPPTKASKNKSRQYPPTIPLSKFETAAVEDVDETGQKKPKRKRRLSFKRLSFRSEKKPEIEVPDTADNTESDDIAALSFEEPEPEPPKPPHCDPEYIPPLHLETDIPHEYTQYQLQPQPERHQSFTSSVRSGLQSIGYAPEAASLPTSPIEPSHNEPMAITSSTPSRAVLALRSSESVSYTGASYYQRFNTTSPTPPGGIISPLPQALPPPAPVPPPLAPQPKLSTPERQSSLQRHTTPPSSYKPPPGRASMDNSRQQPPPMPPQNQQNNAQIRRRPLGNTAIKSNPVSPISTNNPWNSNPSNASVSTSSRQQTSRTNSMTSQYSYNTQSGVYQPNMQRTDSMRSSRGRTSYYQGSQGQPSSYNNGVASGPQPRRRRSTSSGGGSVGPGGYPHMGQDYNSDHAMFGMDFWDGMQVKRADDLVKSYGSTNPPNNGGGRESGSSWYGRRRSTEQVSAMEMLYGEKAAEKYAATGEEGEEDRSRKKEKESFWKKMGRGRSKSRVRASREIVGY